MAQKVLIVSGPYPRLYGREAIIASGPIPAWESPEFPVSIRVRDKDGDIFVTVTKKDLYLVSPKDSSTLPNGILIPKYRRSQRGWKAGRGRGGHKRR